MFMSTELGVMGVSETETDTGGDFILVGGLWKDIESLYVCIGEAWKPVAKRSICISSAWET